MKPRGTRGSVVQDRVTASDTEAGMGRSVQGKGGAWVRGLGTVSGETRRVWLQLHPCSSCAELGLCSNLIRSLGDFHRQFLTSQIGMILPYLYLQ